MIHLWVALACWAVLAVCLVGMILVNRRLIKMLRGVTAALDTSTQIIKRLSQK